MKKCAFLPLICFLFGLFGISTDAGEKTAEKVYNKYDYSTCFCQVKGFLVKQVERINAAYSYIKEQTLSRNNLNQTDIRDLTLKNVKGLVYFYEKRSGFAPTVAGYQFIMCVNIN